jgi:hypothetical protein
VRAGVLEPVLERADETYLDPSPAIAGFRYALKAPGGVTKRRWFERHGGRLVDAMAAPYGPDVTALLETDVTYGVMGDDGGHNRLIQNIPMIFHRPGVGSNDSGKEIRLVDVMPTILETMGIDYDRHDVDGRAVKLSRHERG